MIERDRRPIGPLGEARVGEHVAQEIDVVVERERELDVRDRDAVEAREEVMRVAHTEW